MNKAGVITTLLFLLTSGLSYAQANEFTISIAHARKIEKLTSGREKLKKYHKYFHKDSLKQAKQLDKYWQAKLDSMHQAIVDKEKLLKGKKKKINDKLNSKINKLENKLLKKKNNNEIMVSDNDVEEFSPAMLRLLKSLSAYYNSLDSQQLAVRPELAKLKDLNRLKMPPLTVPGAQNKINTATAGLNEKIGNPTGQVKGKLLGNLQDNKLVQQGSELGGDVGKYKNQYGSYIQSPDSLKGTLQKKGNAVATEQVESRLGGISELNEVKKQSAEVKKIKDLPNGYKTQMDQYTDSAYVKEQAKKKAEEMAMNYLNSNPEILIGVQAKMNLLMKKYSIIPNSNDLSTAVKRSSLKGRTFRERLVMAGNFQILTIDPFAIDFSPQLGYKFNRKFVVGMGGTYRQAFSDTIPRLAPQVFGYKTFASYDVLNAYFAYAEYDRNSPGMKKGESGSTRIWKDALFAGVGRKLTIHPKVEMTIVLAYNFLYQHNDPIYARPWILRVGFQTSELAMLKKLRK